MITSAQKAALKKYRATEKYRERRKELNARHRASAEFRAQNAAKMRRWREKNPKRNQEIAAKYDKGPKRAEQERLYRPKHREIARRWLQANRPTDVAKVQRRVARLRNAPGRGVTAGEWRNCLTESLGLCAYCNERKKLTMDHIDPIIRGGAHDVENIAAVCGGCNSAKNDKTLTAFLIHRARSVG